MKKTNQSMTSNEFDDIPEEWMRPVSKGMEEGFALLNKVVAGKIPYEEAFPDEFNSPAENMTPLKGPGDPGYDANTKQMAKIRAEQGPDARKTDLDEATIAILEDCMNEKEEIEAQDFIKDLEKTIDEELASGRKGTIDREKVKQGFKDGFKKMTNEELIADLKRQRSNSGRGTAKMNYMDLLKKEMEKRGITF